MGCTPHLTVVWLCPHCLTHRRVGLSTRSYPQPAASCFLRENPPRGKKRSLTHTWLEGRGLRVQVRCRVGNDSRVAGVVPLGSEAASRQCCGRTPHLPHVRFPGRAAMQAAGDVPSPLLLELRPQAWGAGLELRHARKRHGGTHHRFSNKGGPYRSRVESFTGRKRCLSCDLVLQSQTKPCDQLAHRQAHDEHRDTDLTRQGGFLMVLVYYIYSTLLDTLPQGDRPFYQLNVSSVIS